MIRIYGLTAALVVVVVSSSCSGLCYLFSTSTVYIRSHFVLIHLFGFARFPLPHVVLPPWQASVLVPLYNSRCPPPMPSMLNMACVPAHEARRTASRRNRRRSKHTCGASVTVALVATEARPM